MELTGWRAHGVYWIAPSLVVLLLGSMYFSDVPVLMSIVAPQINRELGLLENLQNLVLVVLVVLLLRRVLRAPAFDQRLFFGFLALASLFMLLEELDYGTHFWWALHGLDWDTRPVLNIHNQGDNSSRIKMTSDVILALLFFVYPWFGRYLRNPWLRFFCPRKMFVLSVVTAALVADLLHYLEEAIPPKPNILAQGIGEYRELFTYYIWLLYLGTLANWRAWPGASGTMTAMPDQSAK